MCARICVATGARLGIPVFYVEHGSCYEEMLARCQTPSQLRSLFPEVVAGQAERARVSALPPGEQIAYYVSRLKRYDGLINSEEAQKALHGFGSAAIPALLPLLRQREHASLAAKLLADIGVPDETVSSALSAAVATSTPVGASHERDYVHGSQWRDIMSYKANCGGCSRSPVWSNPDVLIGGAPAGSVGHDNARVIADNVLRVAAFR